MWKATTLFSTNVTDPQERPYLPGPGAHWRALNERWKETGP
jgi:hypothetical protein